LYIIAPIVLLLGIIGIFVATDGAGLNVKPAAPIETLAFERTVLKPGKIELHVRNTSAKAITISQININDAIWPYAISDAEIPRLSSRVITLDYPWVEAQAYNISIFTGSSIAFTTLIDVATETKGADAGTLGSFTLVGLYVGIIPVVLGLLWLPALRRINRKGMLFLMAATVGLLLYLGVDALNEANAQAIGLPETFQGIGLIAIGAIGSYALLEAIGQRSSSRGVKTDEASRSRFALMIAIGIGLHNLGEGLAIGAAYSVGAATLGTFLVVGFIIQNITEGLGIVVPIARDRPSLKYLLTLGVIGGAPAIAGTWIGGLVTSPALSVLFLAIGAGAVFQVAISIGRQVVWKRGDESPFPLTAFSGVMVGMLALYITGLVIK
ncbi:MAG: ZIP family metal transporter, partial [Thermomicrobiales bacterium]